MFSMKYIYFYLTILLSVCDVNQSIYQSGIKLSDNGFQFLPVNYPGQILSTFINGNNLLRSCSTLCNENILCRIFDINGVVSNQCRLFQGDITIHGTIIPSLIVNAQVGSIQFSTDLYVTYDQACSSNSPQNRYLICGTNLTWTCPQNTYWNQSISMCVAQSSLMGSTCQQNLSMCREDLNFTCLQFNQCGPLSLLLGTTIADNSTVIADSTTIGISHPYSIIVNKTIDNSIIVANAYTSQVIRFYDYNLNIDNVSLLAQNWSGGYSFGRPFNVATDPNQKSNLYVTDCFNHCVIKISNMQVISPVPTVVAGVSGTIGTATNELNHPAGIAIDSNGNLYIADSGNHRIIKYAPNSTVGSIIAGLGTAGTDSFSLNTPFGIFLDETNSYIYVSDGLNHRIQRFSLNGGSPNNGSTVAGGNGQGSMNTQLYTPLAVYISKKTNAIYIADCLNHRIQRWNQGEKSGVTIAGDPNGNSGDNASMFNAPFSIALNDEETFLYVADTENLRIQRFTIL